MKTTLALIAILTTTALPAAGQNPIVYGRELALGRFGAWLRDAYVGTIAYTMTSGDSHYAASATLLDSRVHCAVTTRSPEGTST